MISKLKKSISALNTHYSEKEKFSIEQRTTSVVVFIALVIGAVANFFSRVYLLDENVLYTLTDSSILVSFGFLHISLGYIKHQRIKKVMSLITYSSLLLYISITFYAYVGPVIWIMGAVYLSISLLSSQKDMMVAFQLTIFVIFLVVMGTKPEFEISNIYYIALAVCLGALFISNYMSHHILTDRMTRLMQQHEQKEFAEKQLYFTLSSIGDAVITTDEAGKITFMNPVAEQLTGHHFKSVRGEKLQNIIVLFDEISHEPVQNPVDAVLSQQSVIQFARHTLLFTKDGREVAIEDTASPILDTSQKIIGVIIVMRDCSFKVENKKQIDYLSNYDQLSGLYNRHYFEKELEKQKTERMLPLAVLFIDINGLKEINDTLGYQKGNALIRFVSNALRQNQRTQDVIARVSGDEFVILMPCTEEVYIKHFIKQIRREMSHVDRIGVATASISYGWDIQESLEQSIFSILKSAEDKMYQNKVYYTASKRNDAIKSILATLSLKSSKVGAHSKRVSKLSYIFGKALAFSDSDCKLLEISGELHDIGKVAIEEQLLNKTESLTLQENEKIKRHPETGYKLLNMSIEYADIATCVYAHHENWDGSGYPRGLKGIDIPLNARIISIVDAYDHLCQDQSLEKVDAQQMAIKYLNETAGKQFDPELVKVFIQHVLAIENHL